MMRDDSFGVQISYASVDRGDSSDPRAQALELLTAHRVLAGLRDASAQWEEQSDAVVVIPMTDDGHVLTLAADDTIETTLTGDVLREIFAAAGLSLWLQVDDADDADDVEYDSEADAAAECLSETEIDEALDEEFGPTLWDPEPVRVAAFSHRAPVAARFLAEANRTPVEYVESEGWSLQLFETAETTVSWPTTVSEGPVIELNRVSGRVGSSWVEVTRGGVASTAVPFWVDAERDTRPVLDLNAITIPETAEIYRRLLAEGDGTKDELSELAERIEVDVDAAHAALLPESLGGVIGEDARMRTFLVAFGVPEALIDVALSDSPVGEDAEASVSGGLPLQRFEPRGWLRAGAETVIGGYAETVPLTRRDRPLPRLARWVRVRPLLGLAITTGELALGVLALGKLRGGGKIFGGLIIVDAVIDAVVWCVRMRRGR